MHFQILTATPDGDKVRVEQLRGDTYLVAPTVLVREGVLNGALLAYEAIERSVPGWNGRPVTAPPAANESGHPRRDGEFVSANQAEFLESMKTGFLQNVEAREDLATPNGGESARGLRGEAWVNLGRTQEVSELAVESARRMAKGEQLEVSTGYFHDVSDRRGTFDGDEYGSEQTDLMPDHLALLPNERGACSWDDGCGAPRANATDSTTAPTVLSVNEALGEQVIDPEDPEDSEDLDDDGDGSPALDGNAELDDEDAMTVLQRIRSLVSTADDDSSDGGDTDGDEGPRGTAGDGSTDTTINETHMELEQLAEQTAFDLDTLQDMGEDEVQALASTVEANDGCSCGGGSNSTQNTDNDGGDGGDGNDSDADDDGSEVTALREQVEDLTETVQTLAEQQDKDPQAEAARGFLSDSDEFDESTLEETPDEVVVNMAADRGFSGQAGAAPRGSGVNRLAQAGAGPLDPTAEDGEDTEEYVANSGALSQLGGDE